MFLLHDEHSPIIYAPIGKKAARVNEAAVGSVGRFLDGLDLDEEDTEVVDILKEHGFFDSYEAPIPRGGFSPTQVTLFPSDGCNLRCRYCYANAGGIRHKLPIEVGKAAIDFVAANAAKAADSGGVFVVGYHGNGEPFTAFDVLSELCRYSRQVAEQNRQTVSLTVATNGVLSKEKQDFLLEWFDSCNISFDGLPELQNYYRPLANGSGSFDAVDDTLMRLQAAGKSFGIRSTLTTDSVTRMPEIADFVTTRYPSCRTLHIEPAWECGRCATTGEQTPNEDAFIAAFTETQKLMQSKSGIQTALTFSGARFGNVTGTFCAVSNGGFTVTTDGYATACYEVSGTSDPRSERFFYGKYVKAIDGFVFDQAKLRALSRLNVTNMPYCNDCFCRWHCAGDCAAKVLGNTEPEQHSGSSRCKITRALTLNQLTESLGIANN